MTLIDGFKKIYYKLYFLGLVLKKDILTEFYLLKSSPKDKFIKSLGEDGIIKIEDFIDESYAELLANEIKGKLEPFKTTTFVNEAYLSFRSETTTYGKDGGIIDIYRLDKFIDSIDYTKLHLEKITEFIEKATGGKAHFYRLNGYINNEGSTRGFHADDLTSPTYKAFLYLTDVIDESYGPYCYVKKSHRFSLKNYHHIIKKLLFSPETLSDYKFNTQNKNVIKMTGSKGTLIISDQAGIHRGLSQGKGKTRIALVFNYCVIRKYDKIPDYFVKKQFDLPLHLTS